METEYTFEGSQYVRKSDIYMDDHGMDMDGRWTETWIADGYNKETGAACGIVWFFRADWYGKLEQDFSKVTEIIVYSDD